MNIRNVENNQTPVAFSGNKEARIYRKAAKSLNSLLRFANEKMYTQMKIDNKSLRATLFDTITIKTKHIGDEFVTHKDVALHNKLKNYFIKFENMGSHAIDDLDFCPRSANEAMEEVMNTSIGDPIARGLANIQKSPKPQINDLPDDFHRFVASA